MTNARRFFDSIPLDPSGNARARRNAANPSDDDKAALRQVVSERSPEAYLVWLALFAWTYDPRRTTDRYIPFTPWPIQVRAGRELWCAVDEGRNALIDKSRDMGASWLCLSLLYWWWRSIDSIPSLVASRKEEYVDGGDNPDTLFWKLRCLARCEPSWLRPTYTTRHMHLINQDNGSVIDGESTNADLGRGGRRKVILLDEFAAVENGEAILTATGDATPCRIFNSTPQGMGNAFANVRFSGKVRVITLPWWDHPVKGKDRYQVDLPDGSKRWRSPWYDAECARRPSKKEIAQELDIDYLQSGDVFFDMDVLQRLRGSGQLFDAPIRGALDFDVVAKSFNQTYELTFRGFRNQPNGPVHVWMKPEPLENYAGFCDIGKGTGASNSVCYIARSGDWEVVAKLESCDLGPERFAEYCVAFWRWYAGQRGFCYAGWEANGPGLNFGIAVKSLGHYAVLGNTDITKRWSVPDKAIGWWSSRDKKAALLGELRSSLAKGELIVHDPALVGECEKYIYYENGGIGPSSLVEEPEGGRATHGDRVIAAAGLPLVLQSTPRARVAPRRAPKYSPAHLREIRERAKQDDPWQM